MRPPPAERALFLTLILLMAAQLVLVARATSATWDEPHHLFDGYTVWTRHDFRLNPEVPPLVKLVAALPLLGMHLNAPPNLNRPIQTESFNDGRDFVFGNGGDRVLLPARMAAMLFTLALAALLYRLTRELFGPWPALFALALFVFDPNFLAHGALVTTDVGMSCALLAALYAWRRFTLTHQHSWRWLAPAGVAAGLCLVVKLTGLLLWPMLVVLIALEAAHARSLHLLGRRLLALLLVTAIAGTMLWGCFGFRYTAGPEGQPLSQPLATYLDSVPNPSDARHLAAAARFHLLPEAYLWGLANTKITEDLDNSYFFGHVYRHGSWRYFPAAFLIKSTLPFLLLLCLVPFAFRPGDWRRLAFLWVPCIVYLAVAMSSKMNIGHRHLLPLYPLLYVLLAGAAGRIFLRQRRWGYVFAALLLWHIAGSLSVCPGYMAYANEAWGGPAHVNRYLSDANSDWAQQLKETRLYLDQHHITHCWIAYFADGAIRPEDYGIRCKRLPTTGNLWWMNLPMNVPPVIDGTVLLSDSVLQGIEFGQGALNPYDGFRGVKPTAAIEHGLFVFDGSFSVPLASALWHANNAGWNSGDPRRALDEAQQAVALAPWSARALDTLGDVQAAQGRQADALANYTAALNQTRTIEPELQADLARTIRATMAKTHQQPTTIDRP